MKVFISWSGEKSKRVAEILKQWIPMVIQCIEPYFSASDIEKGARWNTDISTVLENTSFGILCITSDNITAPWLNFEAGALSKSIDTSRVCPLLFDLKIGDITSGPLNQFQSSIISEEEIHRVFNSINNSLGDQKLDQKLLDSTFNLVWPKMNEDLIKLSDDVKKDGKMKPSTNNPAKVQHQNAEAIDEILEFLRYQSKILSTPESILPKEYLTSLLSNNKPRIDENVYHAYRNMQELEQFANQYFCRFQNSDLINKNDVLSLLQEIITTARKTKSDLDKSCLMG